MCEAFLFLFVYLIKEMKCRFQGGRADEHGKLPQQTQC